MRANTLQGREQGEVPAIRRLEIGALERRPSIAFILFDEFDGFVHGLPFLMQV
jgi:hypothetical protein